MTAKKTGVIGGSGFIGEALVSLLLQKGREVTCVDQKGPVRPNPAVHYIEGDYGQESTLKLLKGLDEVVLLAYSSVPKTSFEDPLADMLDNLPRALEFFKAAKSFGLKKIIVISSGGAVYGPTAVGAIQEDHPTNPISPYGITKLAIEKYALMYRHLYSLPVIILRSGNAYGPGQKPFTGQGFIATAMASVLQGQEIPLYGEGATIRDYVYITDLVEGILSALEKGQAGATYNLGTGVGRSNRAVLDTIKKLAETKNIAVRVRDFPGRNFDVPANVLDPKKLLEDTGWTPLMPFDDGVRRTWESYLAESLTNEP